MSGTMATKAGAQSLTLPQIVVGLLRHYLGGRRGLILLAVAVLGIGAFLNWGWLVAAGIAPLLIGFAPCAVMCALGLCMSRMGGKSCSTESKAKDDQVEAKPAATVSSVEVDERT
ncbi:MAG: hypothetical protein ABI196_15360 [Bradyrhizobium sp.]